METSSLKYCLMKDPKSVFPLTLAMGFAASSLPARAFPGASVDLVRVGSNGVQMIPMVQTAPQQRTPAADLVSQAIAPAGDQPVLVQQGTEEFSITFQDPLPANLEGYLSIRRKVTTGDTSLNGQELRQIPFNSPDISFSADRRTITFLIGLRLQAGDTICALFPDGPAPLPKRLTPCCLTIAAPKPVPTARPFPWWVIPVGLGVGVGICALAGCFSNPPPTTTPTTSR